jgi:hypothetical protein
MSVMVYNMSLFKQRNKNNMTMVNVRKVCSLFMFRYLISCCIRTSVTHIWEKNRISKESPIPQNWKCCRVGLIEPVHERYLKVQVTVRTHLDPINDIYVKQIQLFFKWKTIPANFKWQQPNNNRQIIGKGQNNNNKYVFYSTQ